MATFSPALWTTAQVAGPARPPQFGPRRGAPLALVLAPSRALALRGDGKKEERDSGRFRAERIGRLEIGRGRRPRRPFSPQALQLATACFALVGGNSRGAGSYFPGDRASLFGYEGPKGADSLIEWVRRKTGVRFYLCHYFIHYWCEFEYSDHVLIVELLYHVSTFSRSSPASRCAMRTRD